MSTEDTGAASEATAASSDEKGVNFSKWREANVNDEDYNQNNHREGKNNDDDDEVNNQSDCHFFMFGQDDEEDAYEEIRYEYEIPVTSDSSNDSNANDGSNGNDTGQATTPAAEVVIRHHGAYPNATGLAVWRGAQILARFLCDQQKQADSNTGKYDNDSSGSVSVRGKDVLEVGAGAGLPGIVAHVVLGAARVSVTDGDYDALTNLRINVDKNRTRGVEGTLACRQLIWGKAVRAFVRDHGKQDVVLAADCVYMGPSLAPLWATLDALLRDDGVFVYCQTAASAVPWKLFSEQVELHGFEVCQRVVGPDLDRYDIDDDDSDSEDNNDSCREDEEYEQGVYVFRRRR